MAWLAPASRTLGRQGFVTGDDVSVALVSFTPRLTARLRNLLISRSVPGDIAVRAGTAEATGGLSLPPEVLLLVVTSLRRFGRAEIALDVPGEAERPGKYLFTRSVAGTEREDKLT